MPKSHELKSFLEKAEERAKRFEWLGAAEFNRNALGLALKLRDFSKAGEIQERVAYCHYRGAFQTETSEEFKRRMLEAVEAYETAAEVYEKVEHAKVIHCKAMALYAKSWIQIDASRKKAILDNCGELLKEAMRAFEKAGNHLSYGKACNDLLFCLWDKSTLEWDWTENKRCLEEAIKHGQNAISTLSKVGDERELARAYGIGGLHSVMAGLGRLGEEKREEFTRTALSYAEKALELSKKTGDASLIARSNLLADVAQIWLIGNLELSLKYVEEFLQQAKKTEDSFLIGYAFGEQAIVTSWTMNVEENPDKKRAGYERVIRYAKDAVHYYFIVCRYDYLATIYSLRSENYYFLASEVETDPKERRNLLGRAIEVGQEGLKYAEQSGVPDIATVQHSLSKALYSLSKMETRITEKRRLLEEASEHRKKSIDIGEQTWSPFDYWNRGVFQNYAALIKAELSTIETAKEKKRKLLEEAVTHMERCIESCIKWTTIYPRARARFAVVGWYYDWFGGILNQIYSLKKEEKTLDRAIEAYEGAAETYQKAGLPTRVAEAHWHTARLYDRLGEHTKSEHNFQSSSENYRLAAEKIPQLKEFYTDHALYMQAWSEIEKAKKHHVSGQYGQAKEHYEKAADLHQSTGRWSYLSLNYLAWARLEEGEDLSRREQTEEAKDSIQQAAKLFIQAKDSIQAGLKKITSKDEEELLVHLSKASNIRREYCLGRIDLEEAKLLDRQGDHRMSSKKYGSAAEKFQKATDAMEYEFDRQKVKPIVYLCRAWQMMTRAEAEASPDFYLEASKLFDKAKEHSSDEKAKLLAQGHSCFCKALEAGTRFEATRDTKLHSAATQHLEGAASYYVRAGFKTASEYAKATRRLFDAYVYMDTAMKELEPRKKAQYYQMAEKLLQASAGSYTKAKHPEKSEEVQRLLENVREEQQLAMSLTEVLHAPTTTSTTTSFFTPTSTHEQAVGLEKFDQANILANLIPRAQDVKIGEDISLEIELVNTGKAPALLVKVEEIIPEGFRLIKKPEVYRVEDRYLNMKGKKLPPLKTEEVRLVLRPLNKGIFHLEPRVLYLDETGKYKSHQPEPATVTVRELGISGWLKGPSR